MSNDVFGKVFRQYQAFLAPVVKANRLAVANLEKLAGFQLQMLRTYSQFGLGQLKAAADIRNPNDLQAFYAGQVDAAAALRKQLLDDGQALVDLLAGFKAEFDKLVRDSAAELANKAGEPVAEAT